MVAAIPAIAAPSLAAAVPPAVPAAPRAVSFADLLTGGIDSVNARVTDADRLARAFVLDDSIPVHQVTFALEQARLSLDVMMQVRGRLLDAYQQLMNMQL